MHQMIYQNNRNFRGQRNGQIIFSFLGLRASIFRLNFDRNSFFFQKIPQSIKFHHIKSGYSYLVYYGDKVLKD